MFWQSEREVKLKKELDAAKTELGRLREVSETKEVKEANRVSQLNEKIIRLEKVEHDLKENIADLNAKKKREEELIEHNTKIIIEKNKIEHEKALAKIQEEANAKVAAVKDEYRDKLEAQLELRGSEMKEMYTDVLEKLTRVTGTVRKPAGTSKAGKNGDS